MQAAADLCRHLQVSLWVLLLAACDRGDAYEKVLREQHAQASADAEAERAAHEEVVAEWEAERAQRAQAELAFESDPPERASEDQLHRVLGYYCGDCHFSSPCTCELGGIYLDDVKEMLREGTVVPGNAEGSRVIEQMRMHGWPLPDGTPSPSEVAITLVADFINQLPTPDAGTGN